MNSRELRNYILEGGYFEPLNFYTSSANYASSRAEEFLRFVRPIHAAESLKRLSEIFKYVEPVIQYLDGGNQDDEVTHNILRPFLNGQTVGKIFISGGCAAYLIGR